MRSLLLRNDQFDLCQVTCMIYCKIVTRDSPKPVRLSPRGGVNIIEQIRKWGCEACFFRYKSTTNGHHHHSPSAHKLSMAGDRDALSVAGLQSALSKTFFHAARQPRVCLDHPHMYVFVHLCVRISVYMHVCWSSCLHLGIHHWH